MKALDGYNVTLFAYGQTGSGKTFTMMDGYQDAQAEIHAGMGVAPRLVRDIFGALQGSSGRAVIDYAVRVSCLEVYNEQVYDLLSKEGAAVAKVVIRDNDAGQQVVTGLTEMSVPSVPAMCAELHRGMASRMTASTAMNARSSRSHAIFTITIEQTVAEADSEPSANDEGAGASSSSSNGGELCLVKKVSKIHLVDLAGSERATKTQAKGDRLREAASINKGLLALGNCIEALAAMEDAASAGEGKKGPQQSHVPYRDSKLTRLLKSSLGGNSHTIMLACASPADSNLEETLSTLRYASRARAIKNAAMVNTDTTGQAMVALRRQVKELQSALLASRAGAPASDLGAFVGETLAVDLPSAAAVGSNGRHGFSCACGRHVQLLCGAAHQQQQQPSGSSAGSAVQVLPAHATSTGSADAMTTSRLVAAEEEKRALRQRLGRLESDHARLQAEVAAQSEDVVRCDELRDAIQLLSHAARRALQPTSSGPSGDLSDLRTALESVDGMLAAREESEAAAATTGGQHAMAMGLALSPIAEGDEDDGSDASFGVGDISWARLDLGLDDILQSFPDEQVHVHGAASSSASFDPAAASSSSRASAALGVAAPSDAAAVNETQAAYVRKYTAVSSEIREKDQELLAERQQRRQLERALRFVEDELERLSAELEAERAALCAASATGAELEALRAAVAAKDDKIRALSDRRDRVQAAVAVKAHNGREAALEREVSTLREARADLQRAMKDETARQASQRRALQSAVSQAERRSRQAEGEIRKLQAHAEKSALISRRKNEELATAQRRLRELAVQRTGKSLPQGSMGAGAASSSSAASAFGAASKAILACRGMLPRGLTAASSLSSAGRGGPMVQPERLYYATAAGLAASRFLAKESAVPIRTAVEEMVVRGAKDGVLPPSAPAAMRAAASSRLFFAGKEVLTRFLDGEDAGGGAGGLTNEAAAIARLAEDSAVALIACFQSRDRGDVNTTLRPLLEAEITARANLTRSQAIYRRYTEARAAVAAELASAQARRVAESGRGSQPSSIEAELMRKEAQLTLAMSTVGSTMVSLESQVHAAASSGGRTRHTSKNWASALGGLHASESKKAIKWLISTSVNLAESLDAAMSQLKVEQQRSEEARDRHEAELGALTARMRDASASHSRETRGLETQLLAAVGLGLKVPAAGTAPGDAGAASDGVDMPSVGELAAALAPLAGSRRDRSSTVSTSSTGSSSSAAAAAARAPSVQVQLSDATRRVALLQVLLHRVAMPASGSAPPLARLHAAQTERETLAAQLSTSEAAVSDLRAQLEEIVYREKLASAAVAAHALTQCKALQAVVAKLGVEMPVEEAGETAAAAETVAAVGTRGPGRGASSWTAEMASVGAVQQPAPRPVASPGSFAELTEDEESLADLDDDDDDDDDYDAEEEAGRKRRRTAGKSSAGKATKASSRSQAPRRSGASASGGSEGGAGSDGEGDDTRAPAAKKARVAGGAKKALKAPAVPTVAGDGAVPVEGAVTAAESDAHASGCGCGTRSKCSRSCACSSGGRKCGDGCGCKPGVCSNRESLDVPAGPSDHGKPSAGAIPTSLTEMDVDSPASNAVAVETVAIGATDAATAAAAPRAGPASPRAHATAAQSAAVDAAAELVSPPAAISAAAASMLSAPAVVAPAAAAGLSLPGSSSSAPTAPAAVLQQKRGLTTVIGNSGAVGKPTVAVKPMTGSVASARPSAHATASFSEKRPAASSAASGAPRPTGLAPAASGNVPRYMQGTTASMQAKAVMKPPPSTAAFGSLPGPVTVAAASQIPSVLPVPSASATAMRQGAASTATASRSYSGMGSSLSSMR